MAFESPNFDNPPLVEVACGFKFEKLNKLKIPHIGLFWEKLKKEYPRCEHAEPTLSFDDTIDDSVTNLPLPKVWLINNEDNKLIQFQINQLYFNWRKMGAAHKYPRFSENWKTFKNIHKQFKDFVQKNNLGPIKINQLELTYVNHIPRGKGWETEDDIINVLPNFCKNLIPNSLFERPQNSFFKTNYSLPEENGNLTIKVYSGKRKIDDLPILGVELSVKRREEDTNEESFNEWFEKAHQYINETFLKITDKTIQKTLWGLNE